jgi:1-acyl-sn-glycerol-3-phosphate acyltransferase
MRTLRSIWLWSANLVLILLWLPLAAAIRLFDRDPRHLRTARWFRRLGRVLARVNPWQVEVAGAGHIRAGQNYVVVSNHRSLADIPVISHLPLDTKWLAKAQLFAVPVLGWMMRMAGDVPVDRDDRRAAARALLQCARHLRNGCSVVFFPEGTRSREGKVLPFSEGPFQLAIREQVPLLPLVIEGSDHALPRDTWIFGPSLRVQLHVLPPVDVAGWTVKQSGELRDMVREMIVDTLSPVRCPRPAQQ